MQFCFPRWHSILPPPMGTRPLRWPKWQVWLEKGGPLLECGWCQNFHTLKQRYVNGHMGICMGCHSSVCFSSFKTIKIWLSFNAHMWAKTWSKVSAQPRYFSFIHFYFNSKLVLIMVTMIVENKGFLSPPRAIPSLVNSQLFAFLWICNSGTTHVLPDDTSWFDT